SRTTESEGCALRPPRGSLRGPPRSASRPSASRRSRWASPSCQALVCHTTFYFLPNFHPSAKNSESLDKTTVFVTEPLCTHLLGNSVAHFLWALDNFKRVDFGIFLPLFHAECPKTCRNLETAGVPPVILLRPRP